jgi:hypothetical protein
MVLSVTKQPTETAAGPPQETHIDDERGLRIPEELREFDRQIVIRTPSGTIQHFGNNPLDAYYGFVRERDFGNEENLYNVGNPELVPNQVLIKPEGEDPTVLEVDLDG